MLAFIVGFVAALLWYLDAGAVPAQQRALFIFGKIVVIGVSLLCGLIAYFNKAGNWTMVVLWLAHLGHVCHGQLFQPGYYVGYVEGVLLGAYLVPLMPVVMATLMFFSFVCFLTVASLSSATYGPGTSDLLRHDILISVFMANVAAATGYYFVFNERRKKEEIYRRYADVGKYSAMIFHDIKNLIMAPGLSAEILKKKLGGASDPLVAKLLDTICNDIKRVRGFISDMEQIIIGEDDKEIEVSLQDLVKTAKNLVQSRLNGVQVECPSDAVFRAQKKYLLRALINVMINSADVTLRRKVQDTQFRPQMRIECRDGAILVCDNGGGFSPQMLEQIAKKHPLNGKNDTTGLGFMIIQDYIEALGGSVVFGNHSRGTPEEGAEVRLHLPGRQVLVMTKRS